MLTLSCQHVHNKNWISAVNFMVVLKKTHLFGIHSLGTMNACTNVHNNPSNSCWDQSGPNWLTDRQTHFSTLFMSLVRHHDSINVLRTIGWIYNKINCQFWVSMVVSLATWSGCILPVAQVISSVRKKVAGCSCSPDEELFQPIFSSKASAVQ